MKFQISPWKTIRTSGCYSKRETESKENTKSRSSSSFLNSKNGSSAITNADEIVGLTFHSKKRSHTPVLTITRTKQISSLDEADNGDGLAETVLYACRTGKAASFTVPAVRSAELGGIFALQSGNKQLVFLPPSQQDNGTSQKQIAVDLESPAIQLDLLRGNVDSSSTVTKGTPMVFGVCKDGRVFLASISSSSLQIQYLGHATTTSSTNQAAAAISNVCQLDLRGIHHDHHQQSNNKRQRDGRAVMEETGICILKSTGKTVELVSYIWNDSFRIGGSAVRTNARPLSPKYVTADLKCVVLLGSLTSDTVCIRVADSVLSVSRHDGRLVSRPLPVPSSSKCIAMAGSGTVAILLESTSKQKLSSNELLFVDVRRDMVVGKETFPSASHGQAVALVTDPRENRIAVISKVSDTVTMILSSEIRLVSEEGSVTTLAGALESAIEIDHPVRPRKKGTSQQCHIADGMYLILDRTTRICHI
jgi:hypothetical protein